MNYFDKFPIIEYNNQLARNIAVRAKLSEATRSNKLNFQTYVAEGDERVDLISEDYYDNPGYTWLVWFANQTIDPYYQTPLSDEDLQQHVINKYGSLDEAVKRTAFYRTNWKSFGEQRITKETFASLNGAQKYFTPVIDSYGLIVAYKRKKLDLTVETNAIIKMNGAVVGTFQVGEYLIERVSQERAGTIIDVGDGYIVVKDIDIRASRRYYGATTDASITYTTIDYLATPISTDELQYWERVNCYELELELNEKRRTVILVDNRLAEDADRQLKNTLRS